MPAVTVQFIEQSEHHRIALGRRHPSWMVLDRQRILMGHVVWYHGRFTFDAQDSYTYDTADLREITTFLAMKNEEIRGGGV